jgi:DNA topoisomerase-6 subunit B
LEEIQGEIDLALRACARKLKGHLNKAEKRKKTRAKFEIVQDIIPQIAAKSAAIVGKDVPNLSRTITKIMNVVWIDSKVENGGKAKRVSINIYNYTGKQQSFKVHTLIPRAAMNDSIISEHLVEAEEGKVTWEFRKVPSTGTMTVDFDLVGEMADVFDPEDLYISGINPTIVMGADPLPGDWNIKGIKVIEDEEPEEQDEDEDDEPDYDEEGEVLEDDE